MSRHACLLAATGVLVGALFGTAPSSRAAPPPGHAPTFHAPPASSFHAPAASSFHVPPVFIPPTPQPHYSYSQPSRSFAEPPLASYWRSHYYNGVYPHADNYSYYDLPAN